MSLNFNVITNFKKALFLLKLSYFLNNLKLILCHKIENGNMTQRNNNCTKEQKKSLRPLAGLQHRKKIPHKETDFSWPLYQKSVLFQ